MTRKREQERAEQMPTAALADQARTDTEKMPDGMWVHELTEIRGSTLDIEAAAPRHLLHHLRDLPVPEL